MVTSYLLSVQAEQENQETHGPQVEWPWGERACEFLLVVPTPANQHLRLQHTEME